MPGANASTNEPPSQELPPGTRLEEFIIERVLGSGGFGITYLARDSRLGRKVVIKENLPAQFCWRDTTSLTVQPRQSSGEDADNFQYSLESFEKEAATLASLDHPGIVKVLRSFEANGTAYFVMPFVEGSTFDELIKEREALNRSFTEEELVALLHKVLEALAYLHDRGIYHRDIKPGNILITKIGAPVLIDFGAARQRLSERSLTVIESPGYTPFEQLQSRGRVGPWSDLYALGGTLYKAITGETPAKAADRAFDEPVVPLLERPELKERYSQTMLRSIDHAMRSKYSERPKSAEEWVRSLRCGPGPAPQATDNKRSDKEGLSEEWSVQSAVPTNKAEAVNKKSAKVTDLRNSTLWLGGIMAIALILVGFASLVSTKLGGHPEDRVVAEPATLLPRTAYTRFPWRFDIVATVFWVGDPKSSPWDPEWLNNFGGIDDPNPSQRTSDFTVKGFTPGLNPFYVALPYNDCLSSEEHKPEAAKIIPWFKSSFVRAGRSVLRGAWLAIRHENHVCYAQWENCGPVGADDANYVFGNARPQTEKASGSGIYVSPAVRDYLGMPSWATVDWRFVDVGEIPEGPWSKYGMNNHFVRIKELRDRQQQ